MKDRLGQLIKDVVSYVIFLMFLSFVVHGYRDPEAYRFAKILEKTVIGDNFQEVSSIYLHIIT